MRQGRDLPTGWIPGMSQKKRHPGMTHRGLGLLYLLLAQFFRRIGILRYLAKGKKHKKQKSRGKPAEAETNIVAAIGRKVDVPKGNGAVVGIVEPATTA